MAACYIKCQACDKQTIVDTAHVVIHLYRKQPWLSWMQIKCTSCKEETGSFFGPNNWRQELIDSKRLDLGFISEDYCPDEYLQEYEEVFKLRPLRAKNLTPRQERYIEFFHWLLDQEVTE